MRIIAKSIICIMAAIAALTSCKKDDTLQYNNLTMGNVVDGTFISDQGNIFTVAENNTDTDLSTLKRAIVLCDILNKVENTENEYEIRLNDVASVLTKEALTKTEADAGEDSAVTDPIFIQTMWISGGYLNINFIIEYKPFSEKSHLINLVLDTEATSEGKYSAELRHNSFGEASIYNETQLQYGLGYVSFPINGITNEESAEIEVHYNWYKSSGTDWGKETQDYKSTISYTKGGYEQAPAILAVKATTNLN